MKGLLRALVLQIALTIMLAMTMAGLRGQSSSSTTSSSSSPLGQSLAGSWGQDTDEVSTFLVFLTSHFTPAALNSDLTNLGPLMTMKIHLETLKNHGNQSKTMKPP